MSKKNNDERNELSQKLLNKLTASNDYKTPHIKNNRLHFFHLMRRFWHIVFTLPLLPFIFCLHFFFLFRRLFTGKPVYRLREFYGKKGRLITIRYFNSKPFSNFALFYHVLSGKLSLTGYSLNKEREIGDAFIYDYAPGIINLWYIRSASRTAYEGIKNTDKEFVNNELLKAELNPGIVSFFKLVKAEFLLLARFLIAKFFRSFRQVRYSSLMIDPIFLFNTRLRNISMQQTIDQIRTTLVNNRDHRQTPLRRKIFFVNPDCFNKTFEHNMQDYRQILRNVSPLDWIFADGIGINIAVDMLGYPKNENVNGTDLMPRLAELAADNAFSLFLLGARPGIAEIMKANLEDKFPALKIIGTYHGYFDRQSESEAVVQMINAARADILLVAFGVPHQERWIQEWFARLNSQLVIGVGGLFDFYSGRIKRAPRWLRDVGLEWCFRLVMEPRRMFKRYIIGNPLFLKRVKGLRKAADYLNNLIDEAKKNRRSRIIDLNRDHYLHKKHAELLDLFPLLAEHCALNQIPLCFHWKDHALAQKCSDIFQKVYPQVILSAEVNVNFNQFLVIIADEESKLIDNLISMPDIIALCFIDKRFSHELQFLSITP